MAAAKKNRIKKSPPPKMPPTTRAHGFAVIRGHHQKEVIEDYLEAILDLFQRRGEVRVSELSQYFGVSMATVNQHVRRLEGMQLVTSKPYRSIFLTAKGKKIAQRSLARHQLIIEFLIGIGVPNKTAQLEAEGIEHHLSDGTLGCLARWVKKLKSY